MHLRKILTLAIAALLAASVLSGGCAKKPQKNTSPLAGHSGNYRASAMISYKDLEAVAQISQDTPSSCSVVFESPPSLKDLSFVFRRDSVDLSFKGLSFTFDPASFPGSAAAKLAVSTINRAMKDDGLEVNLLDDAFEVRGIMESGEFKLLLDRETGNIMKLSVPNEELEIEFSNFRFLD